MCKKIVNWIRDIYIYLNFVSYLLVWVMIDWDDCCSDDINVDDYGYVYTYKIKYPSFLL